ncbi:MAG: ribose 5-phosphate isomerase B [Acidimicrobiia bacterium]|nr:ribose 5-phosphate isomerase B [Acidimicrobiia bacterium]NND13903.1 ribose 5-phosphate isomerase B [Acidimicrobiia bacterium]NNL48349.1 ribose 5-phosphate isomerase B [Acidimicrobiia bacterium]
MSSAIKARTIAIGADHAGFALKQHLADRLREQGFDVLDLGTDSTEPVDYPDFAAAVGRVVAAGTAERGLIVCGSGAGASIAANKIDGVRSTVAHDNYTAHQAVEHDDLNVLAIGSRVVGPAVAEELVDTFLAAEFSGEERHVRRLNKVMALEHDNG